MEDNNFFALMPNFTCLMTTGYTTNFIEFTSERTMTTIKCHTYKQIAADRCQQDSSSEFSQ